MRAVLLVASLPLVAGHPVFTREEALRAEWARRPPAFTEAQKAKLPPKDRLRLEQTQARIGAPGAPALLPPEMDKPTVEAWLKKASAARSPQDRFNALHFLNRLKSPKALLALEGLRPEDAAAWPRSLHVEAHLATARLNGAEVSPGLEAFLKARQKAGKVDPVRAQATRLRLVMAGKEGDLLPALPATSGALLACLDAWNRAPWEPRKARHLALLKDALEPAAAREAPAALWAQVGLRDPFTPGGGLAAPAKARSGVVQRLILGLGEAPEDPRLRAAILDLTLQESEPMLRLGAIETVGRLKLSAPDLEARALAAKGPWASAWLKVLRAQDPPTADRVRSAFLERADVQPRSAAAEDLSVAPPRAEWDTLLNRFWRVEDPEGVQCLLLAFDGWKLPPDDARAFLDRFDRFPGWLGRYEAYLRKVKLDPKTPWPEAPAPDAESESLLKEAKQLVQRGKPVRLRLSFNGDRRVILRLDPMEAPLNVAQMVRLARKGFFDGQRIPRMVPDFGVQFGSPFGTQDGGPGYTVPCEYSRTWYRPGTVNMAHSGKDSAGSQFFISISPTPHLVGHYTRLGDVEDLDRALPLLEDMELGATLEKVEVLADLR